MQGNKVHILSTRPLENAIINKAAKHNVIIDVLSFIKIQKIINSEIEKKSLIFCNKKLRLFSQARMQLMQLNRAFQ